MNGDCSPGVSPRCPVRAWVQAEACVSDCSSALEDDPGRVKAYFRRALAREQLGEDGDAMRDAKRALEVWMPCTLLLRDHVDCDMTVIRWSDAALQLFWASPCWPCLLRGTVMSCTDDSSRQMFPVYRQARSTICGCKQYQHLPPRCRKGEMKSSV